jgi:hypothetical protein
MSSFKNYAFETEFEAEWRQFLADLEHEDQEERERMKYEAELDAREKETRRLVQQALANWERKHRRRRRLQWLAIVVLGPLAAGLLILILDRLR